MGNVSQAFLIFAFFTKDSNSFQFCSYLSECTKHQSQGQQSLWDKILQPNVEMCNAPAQLTLLKVQETNHSFAQSFDQQQNAQNQKNIHQKIAEWFGLQGALWLIQLQAPCHG